MSPQDSTQGVCHVLRIPDSSLERYRCALGLNDPRQAILSLARAIAHSPSWAQRPRPLAVSFSLAGDPCLGFFGDLPAEEQGWLALRGRELASVCAHLEYIDFDAARRETARLARCLEQTLGRDEIARRRFVAIPRGGLVVLGLLAYELGLRREQVAAGVGGIDEASVLVDDCVMTGARTAEVLATMRSPRVTLAHLRSHPDLRRAVEEHEPRVDSAVAAGDLVSVREVSAQERERWLGKLGDGRYWVGSTHPVGFAWSEPDRLAGLEGTGPVETGWNLLPPELCLAHGDDAFFPVFEAPESRGAWRAAPGILWADIAGEVLIGQTREGDAFRLSGTAAAIWRDLLGAADAPPTDEADADAGRFRDELVQAGLIEPSVGTS